MNKIKTHSFIIVISIYILLNVNILKAQDIIILTNGDEFKSKVDEIDNEVIKFYKWENLTGAKYSISKSEVFMIRYQSGYIEKYQTKILEIQGSERTKTDKENLATENNQENLLNLTLFYNSGSTSVFNSQIFKSHFYLSETNHNYLDLGIGINKSISNTRSWGIQGILGIQLYNVDKAKYYSDVSSILSSNEFIYNWYTDNYLLITNLGIQGSFSIADKTNQHRLKAILNLSNSIGTDFKNQFSYYDANRGFSNTIYMTATKNSGLLIETGIKYEHKLYKKLGIEFSFSIAAMPFQSTWIGYGSASSTTNSQTYNYGMTIIKSGMGLMFY
jgi:hypothetical protein